MFDTNVVSALMRDPTGGISHRISGLAWPVSVSIVVAAELRYGAARKASDRLTTAVELVLSGMTIEPLASPVDVVYGRLRDQLERQGQPMDANDLLIAAHAVVLDRTLVTADKVFGRVEGLKSENWLA